MSFELNFLKSCLLENCYLNQCKTYGTAAKKGRHCMLGCPMHWWLPFPSEKGCRRNETALLCSGTEKPQHPPAHWQPLGPVLFFSGQLKPEGRFRILDFSLRLWKTRVRLAWVVNGGKLKLGILKSVVPHLLEMWVHLIDIVVSSSLSALLWKIDL